MICPYCIEDVPANSQKHDECVKLKNKNFPPFYVDYHGNEDTSEPIILSVVGFSGHGKTVFLCALFEYLDHYLTDIWPNFFNHVLDQESLSTLNVNREKLDNTVLPGRTGPSFPRPGIFRLTNMPYVEAGNNMPPLENTTVLIYDPPGEAFVSEDKIIDFASFVKRSSCVLFLVDITALGDSIASKMAKLLDTYVLGMRRMGIERQSQHMIVVYTKSDEMKVSVPEFENYLEKEPRLKEHLNDQRPITLANPHDHFIHLEHISHLLKKFTQSELHAGKFINVAREWFASVSYTVVSSLGAAPEKSIDDEGKEVTKLTVKMSPRCVIDPLLYVLAKSIKVKEPPPPPPPPQTQESFPRWLIVTLIGAVALLLVLFLALLIGSIAVSKTNSNNPPEKTANLQKNQSPFASPKPPDRTPAIEPTPPSGMTYVSGGEFMMGSTIGDDYERPPHQVAVRPFFIDVYEVTCEEYNRFIEQMEHLPPPHWRGGQYPLGAAQQPVTGVTWDDAVAYARWAGKRLPTEAEWEFAARGTDGRLYPWGTEWRAGVANAGGVAGGGVVDVGTFKGVSPFGVYDMVGNSWEWTASDLKPYPGGQLPDAPKGNLKVIRGGSWKENPEQAKATYRGYLPARDSNDYSATGFRCVQDVIESSSAAKSINR